MAETRTYDANGNVITDAQYYMKGTTATKAYNPKLDPDSPSYIGNGAGQTPGADIGGYLSTATITRYDTYGRVAAEQTFGHGQNWNGAGGETTPDALPADGATSWSGMDLQSAVLYQGPGNSAGYDAMGNVVFYQYRANSARLDQYTVTYLKKEGYLESSTSGQNITNLANVRPTTDESYYNVRGERIAIAQHTQYAYGTVADTVRAFAFDGNGQIIARRDGTAKDDTIDQGTDPTLKNQHYVYVNGQQVAHYDEHSTVDVLSEVTAFSSGNGTGDYVVQDGDTLKSIAQAVYGNASLWYIVAQANALGGDADLAAGLSLTIPAVTTTKNDSTTFKPYNPSEIQGSTMPDLPVIAPPPPPPKQHCNVIAAVIVIAVVVVASVFTFGAAAAALGDIGAAALAGAAGSAAGQLAGDALGTHQGFSLGEVFTSAATAAATAGVGQWLGDTSAAATAAQAGADTAEGATAVSEASSWSVFGLKATEAAAGYVAQDAAAKLVGEPAHFSWAGLVSNSIAGGVAGLIGPTQQQVQAGQAAASPLRMGAAALAQGVVQREASRALGDDRTPSWEQIGEQAAGAALGSALSPSRQPSTQDTLSSWNRSGGGINAYSGLATDGTSYSLAGETQGSSGYAYLDNGSSLHPYDLTSYAATLASSPGIATSSGMRTTFDSGVGDSDINWADRDHPTLLEGMSDSRAPMFSLTAQDPQTFGGMTVHANPAGVYDEHYDPVWAQQQAALSAQQSAMDAGNQQRLNDFFNDGALHMAGAPVYAAVGLGKELVNGAHFVASKVYAGMAFQAARSAEFGATVRGDEGGMASAEALQNRALADAAAPVTPLLHVSDFEHTAAQAFGLVNPEELAVSGISLADRLASGAPAVTDLAAGAYAARGSGAIESDGMMAVRDSLPAGQDGVTSMSGMADPVGMAQLPYVRQPVADVAWEAQPVFAAQGGGFEGGVSGGVGSFVRGTSSELELSEAGVQTPETFGDVPSNFGVLRSPSDLMGVEPASPELISAISEKRSLIIAQPGSDELRMLDYFGAEASVGGIDNSSILLTQNPSKAAILEEFLHGTQSRLGIIDRLGTSGYGSAETHVKDFMIRHQGILGLSNEDVQILRVLKDKGL